MDTSELLKEGQQAPGFSLSDQNGRPVKLTDYRGRKVLLYFYPKADTPGCTAQSCSVRDARQELKQLSVEAVGISPDRPEDQKKFDAKYSLGFPLLSDRDHATAAAYGVWKSERIVRSSFLIDGDGKVLRAWYAVKPEDTVPRARESLKEIEAASGLRAP
jgi:peroxiredoxin Q/BCP